MDIQRKAFEEWAKANGYHVAKNPIGEVYLSLNCNSAWKAWQAAKAQAVPEGFKVVSFKQISELVVAVNKVDLMTHTEQKTNEVRLAWQDIASKMQAMIEAQEQPK